jgi:hypothetical protein
MKGVSNMNQADDLYDKVLYYKGRVWTIYALTGNYDGVFVYQGLKPYSTFQYDSYRHDRNISYIKMHEVLECIIEGEQIQECVKSEKAADAKKLNKKMAVDFLVNLTGHARSKVNSEIVEQGHAFTIVLGSVRYDLFKLDGRLHLHHNIHGTTEGTVFDFVTWKHDTNYEDKQREKERKEEAKNIIEDYKYRYQCECDKKKR